MTSGIKGVYFTGMLYFRIPKEIEAQFKAAAKAQDKTPSALGRQLVMAYLERYQANQLIKN